MTTLFQVLLSAFAIVLSSLSGPAAAGTAYILAPGDVLLLSISGTTGSHRATVDADGKATLPVVGTVDAAGSTLAQVSQRLTRAVSGKVMRRTSPDGRDTAVVLSPEDVTLTVAEYRPVYVMGDVAKPGAQPFRPGLRVRQVIALAGGYDLLRMQTGSIFLELADAKGDHDAEWSLLVRHLAAQARLQAELSNSNSIDFRELDQVPLEGALVSELKTQEQVKFQARREAYRAQRNRLVEAMKREDMRIDVLREQQAKEKDGAEADAEDARRAEEMFRRRQVTQVRLNDSRRTSLLSATRLLQTVVQTQTVERQKDELAMKLEAVEDQRRIALLEEQATIKTMMAQARAKIRATRTKLAYGGALKSELTSAGGDRKTPDILIVRSVPGGGTERLAAEPDATLTPGS